jgi:hypothetical protein
MDHLSFVIFLTRCLLKWDIKLADLSISADYPFPLLTQTLVRHHAREPLPRIPPMRYHAQALRAEQ